MDFRAREVDFQEADRRHAELVQQRDDGSISDEEFEEQRQQLRVQDDEGRWWAKLGESGRWHYTNDGNTWVKGTPPGYQEDVSEPTSDGSLGQTPRSEGVENGDGQRVPFWIPLAGISGIALLGIVLIVWVVVPYLWGGPASSAQGEAMMGKQAAPDGSAFEAVFIHRATSENISTNNTYLDNPQINADPNVILSVTQNWNPGGVDSGIYNDHPIGVWFDRSRQRWAIFNQDREPMPDEAAFNVAVLPEPTE